jgi:DegV family protein with EDD domain
MAAHFGITVLPAYVNIGDESYLDRVELTREAFYRQLPHYDTFPTTAAPAVGVFASAYEKLAAEGATEILSIHLAASLSGMLNAARLGAEMAKGVEVGTFDSQQITMGLGFIVVEAARQAATGKTMAAITEHLHGYVPRTHVYAMLDTLEFLRRSGRVGWAEFGLGTLLRVKPLLHVYESSVDSLARVRTTTRAMAQLIDYVADLGPLEEVALLHTANEDGLATLRQQAQHLFPADYEVSAVEVTPTIGAHVGPGGLGFACVVAPSSA